MVELIGNVVFYKSLEDDYSHDDDASGATIIVFILLMIVVPLVIIVGCTAAKSGSGYTSAFDDWQARGITAVYVSPTREVHAHVVFSLSSRALLEGYQPPPSKQQQQRRSEPKTTAAARNREEESLLEKRLGFD